MLTAALNGYVIVTHLQMRIEQGSSYSHLCNKPPQNKLNSSGIYRQQCKTCTGSYVGQSDRSLGIRQQDHTRYIKTNYSTSAYELHILNNTLEYGNT